MSHRSLTDSTPIQVQSDGSGSREPIIPGFYPDPTVCRVGDDYYLATSSFEYFPGVPLFHSTDLVSWTQVGHILTRRSQFRRGSGASSTGIYAGTLRHHGDRFWFITTNVSDFGSGQLLVSADEPAGPWSDPTFIPDAIGIDPDLCWDDDGDCYLTWKAMDFATETGIMQARVDLESGTLFDEPYPIWQGSGLDAAEGPHIFRRGGSWYLILAEGGTERGHSVTIARAAGPDGPWEPHPDNPIFSRRSVVAHPVQNVGHADMVERPDGSWACVYLGVRNRGSTPGFHVLGRETFLAGVDWVDGWPVLDDLTFEVPRAPTDFVDDFDGDRLSSRWVTPGGDPEDFVDPARRSGIVLRGSSPDDSLLCTRVRDLRWRADAAIADAGRFLLRLDERHWYGLEFENGVVRASAQVGEIVHHFGSAHIEDHAVLRIESVDPRVQAWPLRMAGPDDVVLSVVASDGAVRELGRLDGRYLSTEVASGFTGRMLAVGAAQTDGHLLSVAYTPQ